MQEELKKEILTVEIIKKDIKGILIYNVLMMLIFTALFCFFAFLFHSICTMESTEYASLLKADLIIIVTFLVLSVPFLLQSIYCTILLITFQKGCFSITTDRICDIKINKWLARRSSTEPQRPILSFGIFKTGFNLFFEKHKKYNIATGGHYGFSLVNKMLHFQQFNSSEIGDEIYLAKVGDRIIEIYNTKLFELQE